MQRFFTADWHLNSTRVINAYNRPFPNAKYMNDVLISGCNLYAKKNDIVIHLGDLYVYGKEDGQIVSKINPIVELEKIDATFVNIKGNHDNNNKVKSIGSYLRTSMGPFTDVSLSHYPSTNPLAAGTFLPGDIHLCGHVHDKFKYLIDKENQVLNINVGIDVWGYKIISEDKLIAYIKKIMSG